MMSHSHITEYIKNYGDRYLQDQSDIAIAVSGGPDSMCLLHAVKQRRIGQQCSLSSLHIITCDHNTRENIQQEIHLVESESKDCTFHCVRYEGSDHSEQALRIRRHTQFVEYCRSHDITYLLTGHHLNDRIETTLLNMKRGAGMKGITGISVSDSHFLDPDITILRPLIMSSKDDIITYCGHYQLAYTLDPTNNNTDYSERNLIRKLIAEYFHTPQFTQSRQTLYNHLDDHQTTPPFPLVIERDVHNTNLSSIKSGQRTPDELYKLYKRYNITINPRSNTLLTLCNQLNKKSGNKIHYEGLHIRAYNYASVIKKIEQ